MRFFIDNFTKTSSLYSQGLLPLVCTVRGDAPVDADAPAEWERAGTDVVYFRNRRKHAVAGQAKRKNYYTLSFVHVFQRPGDIVFFAHCHPYSYSDLQHDLAFIAQHPSRSLVCNQRPLCHTLVRPHGQRTSVLFGAHS